MIQKCSCGNVAVYAVGDSAQPMCLRCMLEAVDTPIAVPVRTLDPWETNPPETNNAPGATRSVKQTLNLKFTANITQILGGCKDAAYQAD